MKILLYSLLVLYPIGAFGTDAAEQPNLLQNPSIEDGDDKPKEWKKGSQIAGVAYSWSKERASKGDASLSIEKTAQRYFPIASWTQSIKHQGKAKSIRVSAMVKAEDAHKAVLDVLFLDSNDKWISHKWAAYIGAKKSGDPPASHGWKRYKGDVAIPDNTAKIVIGLQGYGPGTVYFDDVCATYLNE